MDGNRFGTPEEVDRLHPHGLQAEVEYPQSRGQQQHDHRDHDHGRDEIRGIGDQLHRSFEDAIAHFIQADSQDDRDGKPHDQRIQAQGQCILEQCPEHRIVEKQLEVFEPDPRAAPNAFDYVVVLEGDHGVAIGIYLNTKKYSSAGTMIRYNCQCLRKLLSSTSHWEMRFRATGCERAPLWGRVNG